MAPRLNALQRDTLRLWIERNPNNQPKRTREVFDSRREVGRLAQCVTLIGIGALKPAGGHRFYVAAWAIREASITRTAS
jgi:hypothetical protein